MTLTNEKLELFLKQGGERDIFDFKEKHYFDDNKLGDKDKTADFIKDILCFTNTIRSESAFILIGIDNKGIVVGISDNELIDDSILQQKIRNKIYPIPKFLSYPYLYKGHKIAVIEIPVQWYQSIPLPTISLKGLEQSTVYIRRSSSNDTAKPDEIVRLDNWLKGLSMLPENGKYFSIEDMHNNIKPIKKSKTIPGKITFDEISIQNLFGNEAAEDEDIARLREYYFKNETYDSIAVDLPIRILVGHKGIGKSALFKVAMNEDIERRRVPIVIKPDDVAELAQGQEDFLKTIRSWKIGIIDIIGRKISEFFNLNLQRHSVTPPNGFLDLRNQMIKHLIDSKESNELSDELGEFANKFIEGEPLNVYIDDLDRGWLGGRRDIERISALLNAIRDLTNSNAGLQFKISLRSDVYFLVRTSDESTDKIQGSVIWHKWTNHEILIMLIKRIETFLGRDVNEKTLIYSQQRHIAYYLDSIMEKSFRGNGKWENVPMYRVLMSLIRKRPRDLVKLLTLAARIARKNGSNIILTDHFREVFDEYSQDRLQDTINEYRSELPSIERLLLGMRPTKKNRLTINNYSYKTYELTEKLNNIMQNGKFKFSNGEDADAKSLLHFLYKINFLTARKDLPTGEIDRKYFEENRYLTSRFVDFGYDWEVHMAYRWALQPLSIDDIFDRIEHDF